ncbi:uncharacterized protein LOC141761311 [Sebastes fasciatus]|uniref:uncharacterized protein LOC141761311 n=1 Tax=Sebastes fasciatus TaxID=394691 RepID=UPI003D9F5027
MERFSVMMVVCLLAGLSECKSGCKDNQTQITMPDIVTTNSPATQPSGEPTIYTVLEDLGALEKKLATTVRALEETNKKLEASEKKLTTSGCIFYRKPNRRWHHWSSKCSLLSCVQKCSVQHWRTLQPNHRSVFGYFTAPVQGVYYFTFSSFYWGGDGTTGGSLYRNSQRLVSWYGHAPNHPLSGSNTAILHLQVGDHVNVRLWKGLRISDNVNKYSTFSGFLLFPV